jgi:hypothetical protein
MPTTQPQHRLGVLMDQRRGELRLRWKDVAARAGISYEGIRAVRNGTGAIRALTELGIEDALQWERGSIRSVLDGGDPVPREPAATLPPMTPAELRDVLDYLQFKRASNTSAERGA